MSLSLATFNGYKGLLIFNQKHVFSGLLLVLQTIKMEIFFKTKVKCFFLPIQLGCILKLHSIMGPLQKHKNKEMPQSLEVSKVQSNDYQLFEISDSLCFCAFVAKLYFQR